MTELSPHAAFTALMRLIEDILDDQMNRQTLNLITQNVSIDYQAVTRQEIVRPKPKGLASRATSAHERVLISRYEARIYKPLMDATGALAAACDAAFGKKLCLQFRLSPEIELECLAFDRNVLLARKTPLVEVGPILERLAAGLAGLPDPVPFKIPGHHCTGALRFQMASRFKPDAVTNTSECYRNLAQRGEIAANSPAQALGIFDALARAICGIEPGAPLPGLIGQPNVQMTITLAATQGQV